MRMSCQVGFCSKYGLARVLSRHDGNEPRQVERRANGPRQYRHARQRYRDVALKERSAAGALVDLDSGKIA
jgi:hypothetical protein